VVDFYNTELTNRAPEREARLQRYAKYRMWSNGTDWPWAGASDQAIPDMLQDSLRVQDTLHNAVMSQKPPVIATANAKEDEPKQKAIDDLIQYQLFREQPGEKIIGEMAESFTNDPALTVFVPWVKEKRKVADIRVFDEIPEGQNAKDYFFSLLRAEFPKAVRFDDSAAGWSWKVSLKEDDDDPLKVDFYTDEAEQVEMVKQKEAIVYDGPCVIVKDYDDVICPGRCANLQPPGPSNSGGAPFVILRDFPALTEIKRLKDSGSYDLLTDDELKRLETTAGPPSTESESAQQKDTLAGTLKEPGKPKDKSHGELTRLICFDTYDIDGDGKEEDVIFWVIKETKTLLKVRLLTDMYPGSPPMRPFAGESFLPVNGRRSGMSLLEIMEGVHDAVKVITDQSINANDLSIANPGYYRPSGGMNPEVLRIEPFTLTPLQNPQQDVVFPQMGNPNAMGFALNMISILGMWQDKVTMVTDHAFGQVAPGSSSALRTTGNMSILAGQNEARPERILRRFFTVLTDVYRLIHRLNQSFLPKGKQFRISGVVQPNQDPYRKIATSNDIAGDFQFGFDANVLNTSKAALQQNLESLLSTLVNPLMLQMGVVTPENVYNLVRDYVNAKGQPANRYTTPSSPEAAMPKILAEEAIHSILSGQEPSGLPLEAGGAAEHLSKLIDFAKSGQIGLLDPDTGVDMFRAYMVKVRQLAMRDQQKAQMMQNAQQFAQGRNQGSPGAPTQLPPQGPSGGRTPNQRAERNDERVAADRRRRSKSMIMGTCGGERPCKWFTRYSAEYDGGKCALQPWRTVASTSAGHPVETFTPVLRADTCEKHADRELSQPAIFAVVGYGYISATRPAPITWPHQKWGIANAV
jgi:hypothetical protein